MPRIYTLERDCCLSGQCFHCQHRPQRVRMIQLETKNKELAEQAAENWKPYNAVLTHRDEPSIVPDAGSNEDNWHPEDRD